MRECGITQQVVDEIFGTVVPWYMKQVSRFSEWSVSTPRIQHFSNIFAPLDSHFHYEVPLDSLHCLHNGLSALCILHHLAVMIEGPCEWQCSLLFYYFDCLFSCYACIQSPFCLLPLTVCDKKGVGKIWSQVAVLVFCCSYCIWLTANRKVKDFVVQYMSIPWPS